MYRLAIAALLGAISLTACAQSSQPAASTVGAKPAAAPAAAGNVDQRVSTALKALDPDFKPDYLVLHHSPASAKWSSVGRCCTSAMTAVT